MSVRRAVSWAAIYAIALQTILVGILPLTNGSSIAGDAVFTICRSDNSSFASPNELPSGSGDLVGHDCHHCVLCNASVSPIPPDTFIAVSLSLNVAHVFRPHLSAQIFGVSSNPKLARGPPKTVLA